MNAVTISAKFAYNSHIYTPYNRKGPNDANYLLSHFKGRINFSGIGRHAKCETQPNITCFNNE